MCSAGAAPLRVRHRQRGESEASALLLTTSGSARTERALFELTRKETSHPPPNKSLQLSAPGFGPGLKPLVHTNSGGGTWPAILSRRCRRAHVGGRAPAGPGPSPLARGCRGANGAGRAPRGFGTWALAPQLSDHGVRRTDREPTHERAHRR